MVFGEMSVHEPELGAEFSRNQESQGILYRNGASLIGALNFFTENVGTFVFTTIEDTVASWRSFQEIRLEYDAERTEYEQAKQDPKPEDLTGLEDRYSQAQRRYLVAKEAVEAKLQMLDYNKINVMKRQLKLFNSAVCAFFAGNQESLEKILEESHLSPIDVDESRKMTNWLDQLHGDVAKRLAPAARPLGYS
eukprot:m.183332 g.183332  ORF g.183332 m.183332 type:complete len:193 (+) comp15542_c0_seq8:991-1569(+)